LKSHYLVFAVLMVFGAVALGPGLSAAGEDQPPIHIVEKGDTLWDICEKYYGDPTLWPKLWEMNPFVTNPHLLKPGDRIRLMEDVPFKEPVTAKVPEEGRAYEEALAGVDISGLTHVDSMGFLSEQPLQSAGRIISAQGDRVMLAEGDKIYVSLKEQYRGSGRSFTVYRSSPLLKEAEAQQAGYTVTFLGRLRIHDEVREGIYLAEVMETYKSINLEDQLLPYQSVSPCVQPRPGAGDTVTEIAAAKDQRELMGQFNVVYLTHGYNHGVRRGNLLKVLDTLDVETNRRDLGSERVLGYLLVVEARPVSATAVLIASTEEIPAGSVAVDVNWSRARKILSRLPPCSVR